MAEFLGTTDPGRLIGTFGVNHVNQALRELSIQGELRSRAAWVTWRTRALYNGAPPLPIPEPSASAPAYEVTSATPAPDALALWGRVLAALEDRVPRSIREIWLQRTRGLRVEAGVLVVLVPTLVHAEWLERRLYQTIQGTVAALTGRPDLEVRFAVAADHL